MQLRQLTYFLRTAELGSINAAAESLHVSQPAVGVQIKKLEDHLGVALFERNHTGVQLTPAGQLFLASSRDVMARLDASVTALARFRKPRKADVRLGVTSSPSRVLLTAIMETLSRDHPEINLIVKQGSGEELKEWLEAGDLDLAISHSVGSDKRVEAEPVAAQEFYLIGPPELLGTNAEPISFADLGGYPLIQGGSKGSLMRKDVLDKLAADQQIELDFASGAPINVRHEVMQTLARCTISFYSMFAKEISSGELSARPIQGPALKQILYLMRSNRSAASSAETITRDVIRAHIRDVIDHDLVRWHGPDWQPRSAPVREVFV
jgi:LysR family nitrogen assimilation transcriptional regulator